MSSMRRGLCFGAPQVFRHTPLVTHERSCTHSFYLLPLLRCKRGYSGVNCTIEACSRPEIQQNECENQTCRMDEWAYNGYQCIPNECESGNPCEENERCAQNHTVGEIVCIANPCSVCSEKVSECEFKPLSSEVICHCRPGFDPKRDCKEKKPCDNESEICENGGTCGNVDDRGFHSCNCVDGKSLCRCSDLCHHVPTVCTYL